MVEPPKPVDVPVEPAPVVEAAPTPTPAAAPAKAEAVATKDAENATDYSSLEDEMARLLDELAGDLKSDKPA